MSKLEDSQQKGNMNIYYLCKNWISLSQFFIEWLLPAIRLLQLNWNSFNQKFRPDAIDLSLCNHRKTDKGVLEVWNYRIISFDFESKIETFLLFFTIFHFADTLSLTTRIEMYLKMMMMLSSFDIKVVESHWPTIIVNPIGKVNLHPKKRYFI